MKVERAKLKTDEAGEIGEEAQTPRLAAHEEEAASRVARREEAADGNVAEAEGGVNVAADGIESGVNAAGGEVREEMAAERLGIGEDVGEPEKGVGGELAATGKEAAGIAPAELAGGEQEERDGGVANGEAVGVTEDVVALMHQVIGKQRGDAPKEMKGRREEGGMEELEAAMVSLQEGMESRLRVLEMRWNLNREGR